MHGVSDRLLRFSGAQDLQFLLSSADQKGSGDTPGFDPAAPAVQDLIACVPAFRAFFRWREEKLYLIGEQRHLERIYFSSLSAYPALYRPSCRAEAFPCSAL